MSNPQWKIVIAVVAVLCLATPAALGVFAALAPTRGVYAASLAAIGIELSYLALAVLALRPDLRRQARAVALSAVSTSVLLNVVFDYSARNPGALASWPEAVARFDPLLLVISIVESAPLAVLAFSLAMLIHRLGEAEAPSQHTPDMPPSLSVSPAYAREAAPPMPVLVTPDNAAGALSQSYQCPHCGSSLATAANLGAAKRWGHCPACKEHQ
jgi:hypothetical protein